MSHSRKQKFRILALARFHRQNCEFATIHKISNKRQKIKIRRKNFGRRPASVESLGHPLPTFPFPCELPISLTYSNLIEVLKIRLQYVSVKNEWPIGTAEVRLHCVHSNFGSVEIAAGRLPRIPRFRHDSLVHFEVGKVETL